MLKFHYVHLASKGAWGHLHTGRLLCCKALHVKHKSVLLCGEARSPLYAKAVNKLTLQCDALCHCPQGLYATLLLIFTDQKDTSLTSV